MSLPFIICVEVLTSLLINVNCLAISLVFLWAWALLKVSHLLFADDNIFFCTANSIEWSRILSLLEIYENAPGQ